MLQKVRSCFAQDDSVALEGEVEIDEAYVGGVGINSMEGFWSHFKRMVDGVYHHISIAYLQRYVDEECFRWNTKHLKSGARFEIVFGACLGKFTYDDVKSVVRNVA